MGGSTTVPQDASQFDHESAYERYVLSRTYALGDLAATQDAPSIDLRELARGGGRHIAMSASAELGGNVRQQLLAIMRPLLFGAAWKILDLLVELSLNRWYGYRPKWTIADKVSRMKRHEGDCPLPTSRLSVWRVMQTAYAETVELRHALIHRELQVKSDGSISTGLKASPPAQMAASEQEAFLRAIQRGAAAVIDGHMTDRALADLDWNLCQLRWSGPTALPNPSQPVVRVIVEATVSSDGYMLDLPWIMNEARQVFASAHLFDVEVHWPPPATEVWVGELETAELVVYRFDPSTPPTWLRRL